MPRGQRRNISAMVRSKLKRKPYHPPIKGWLDTGNIGLNAIFGHSHQGIAIGKMIEISGQPSSGKTALAMDLAAVAQTHDYYVIWIDFEQSFDVPESEEDKTTWAARRGLRCWDGCEDFSLVMPIIATVEGEKTPRLTTAQEVLEEAELTLVEVRKRKRRALVVLDSVTAMLTEGEAEGGLYGNMKTDLALSKFMSKLCRRWVSMLPQLNASAVMINQLRHDPKAYGDPWYSPGGNALPFYAHVRARMRRSAGGRIMEGGEMVGVKGILQNLKNKAGGTERREIGYKIFFGGDSKFFPAKLLKKKKDEE